jgi:dipeptidyl aminopeptidase/acylaminoacyl peptidase
LSTVERSDLYQCVVSIAGVTDPIGLGQSLRNFIGGRASQLFIGMDEDIREAGSPIARADEFDIPMLLFHAEKDINVPFD